MHYVSKMKFHKVTAVGACREQHKSQLTLQEKHEISSDKRLFYHCVFTSVFEELRDHLSLDIQDTSQCLNHVTWTSTMM
jgi:hypothetical protein